MRALPSLAVAALLALAGCDDARQTAAPAPPAAGARAAAETKAAPGDAAAISPDRSRCSAAAARSRPLVVIGADGLEERLLLEMLAAGRLPAIGSMLRDGGGGLLATLKPAISPPIWTTMATGMLPARHGIDGFVRRSAGARREGAGDGGARGASGPRLLTSRDRRVKAVWDIAADAGLSPCVVGWWMTWPVEELRGTVVAQTAAPPGSHDDGTRKGGLVRGTSGQVQPAALEPRIFALAESAAASVATREQEIYGDRAGWPETMERLVRHSRWSLAADLAYERIALDLLREPGRCDLLLVYFGLPDVLGHRFWRWTAPGDFRSPPPADEVARYGEVLRREYDAIDRFVAGARDAAGPGATIVLASDHGMGPFRPDAELHLDHDDGELIRTGGHSSARDAVLVASGRGIGRSGAGSSGSGVELREIGSVADVTPTLLALLGLPRGADMDGRALATLLDPASCAATPPREVPTHTPPGWNDARRFAAGAVQDEAQRLEQLRALGYLD